MDIIINGKPEEGKSHVADHILAMYSENETGHIQNPSYGESALRFLRSRKPKAVVFDELNSELDFNNATKIIRNYRQQTGHPITAIFIKQ